MNKAEFDFLRDFLYSKSGLSLTDEKEYLIKARLKNILKAEGLNSISELVVKLKKPGLSTKSLVTAVVEAMTTNESFFFRDKAPFEVFTDHLVPELFEKKGPQEKVRIWCAACSTGQEPYSLGMCINELDAKYSSMKFEIVATDISQQVLTKAIMGVYSQFEVQRGMAINLLIKYFEQHGDKWHLSPEIKSMIKFQQLNLLDPISHLGTFDIIFCRNVLIYFDLQTKSDVIGKIYESLSPEGYLVLGAPEMIVGPESHKFEPVQHARGIYKARNLDPSLEMVS